MITKHSLITSNKQFTGYNLLHRDNAVNYMQEGYIIVSKVQDTPFITWYNTSNNKYEGMHEYDLGRIHQDIYKLDKITHKEIIIGIMNSKEVEELHNDGWWEYFGMPEDHDVEFNILVPYNVKESSISIV